MSTRSSTRAAVLVALVTIACAAGSASASAPPSTPVGDADSFPVTITHGQGTVPIPARPQRVVAIGPADTEIAAALGATIVGTTANPGSPDGNWPGVDPPLPTDVVVLDGQVPNLEQIAALDPDVILATAAGGAYNDAYDELTTIAPVISYSTAPLQDSGDDLVTMIGAALGRSEQAAQLITDADAAIAEFIADHPELAGISYAFGQYAGGVLYLVVGDQTQSVRFLSRLGLTVPDELAALSPPGTPMGLATPSAEQYTLLDAADVALISANGDGAADEFQRHPLIAGLELTATGRMHIIPIDLAAALLQPNPAITTYLLDGIAPILT